MSYECISYEEIDNVGLIKLNRPRVLNAMNRQLWLDMLDALERARSEPRIKVLVFTGEGRAFSSGADLKDSQDRSLEALMDYEIEGCLACVSTKERQESLDGFARRKEQPKGG